MKNIIKSKTVSFGKVDYNNTGRRNHEVTVEFELSSKDDKICFTMSGNVWNTRHTDIVHGGQCIDTLLSLIPTNSLLKRMHDVWQQHHLNDMHPECEHQAKNWDIHKKIQVPNKYNPDKLETKYIGFVYPHEHPEGILAKPCEVCGYKYGTSWNHVEIPQNVIDEIMSW